MVLLLIKLVTNGLLVVKTRDNHPVILTILMDKTLTGKILMDRTHGANQGLDQTLLLALIRSL